MSVIAQQHWIIVPSRYCTRTSRLAASIASACIIANVAAASAAGQSEGAEKKQASGLEEVIVTAQRREQRLIDTPISIGVLTGSDVDRSGVRSVSEILGQFSGVSVAQNKPGRTIIAIRGVQPEYFSSSTVGYYLDEVPFAFNIRSELPDLNAFDLERVEVLRGSQGTLYGVNAMSGVVRVLTNNANLNEFEAKGRVRASDTAEGGNNYGGDFAVNVPLVRGKLAVRGVASYSDMSGYIDSTFAGRSDINDLQAEAYRFKVNYQPTENASVVFGFSRSIVENGAPSETRSGLTTPSSDQQFDRRVYNTYNLIAGYTWSNVSLLSSTAYVDYQADSSTELQVPPPLRLFDQRLSLKSFSQEVRLSSNTSGPWQWSAGGFYKDTTETVFQDAPTLFPAPFIIKPDSESYAFFGELTRSFGDGKVEVTGGARYFADEQLKPNLSNFGAALTPAQPAKYDRMTGRLVASYKPQSDRTYYASVATGFRSGLTRDAAVAAVNPNFPGAKPDSLISYELGTKGALLQGAIVYDAAVYYTDWKDIQQQLRIPVGATSFSLVVNGGRASGVGFDTGVTYYPTSAFSLRAAIGWSDLKFAEDVLSFDRGSGRNVLLFPEDGRINSSPAWTGSIGGNYRISALLDGMDIVLSSTYAYRSTLEARTLSGATLIETSSEDLRELNARLGLESDQWSVELYADNLLDERAALSPSNITTGMSDRQRPRTIGVQLDYHF
jgi:iron complex outermembrane recepter protein